jgi:cellulose synthase/poly-beta-1,6-N-acetylglucosamine synthase-like glycosyltransferase
MAAGVVSIITLRDNPGKNRKQFALGRGINAASGEIFLFTDADCEVKPDWVTAMAAHITARENTGACLAPVLKRWWKDDGDTMQDGTYFDRYQCYDHVVRYLYLAGSAGMGSAGGGFGNNLCVRREAMEAAGGYEAVPESATEDAALVSLIRAKTRFQVRALYDERAHVLTAQEASWPAMLNQTLRWQIGGLRSPDFSTRFSYSALMYMITLSALAILALPFLPALWPMAISDLFVMVPTTCFAFAYIRASLPRWKWDYILHAALTPFSFALLTLADLFHVKFKWK